MKGNRHNDNQVVPRTEKSPEKIDEKDKTLVESLRVNARLSYAELGTSISLSADAVRARVERLINEGFIRLVTLVDPALVGKSTRISIGINVTGNPDEFARWANEQIEIIHLARTLGSFDFFGEMVSESDYTAHQFIVQKLRAAPGVTSVEVWPMLNINKWRQDTRSPSVSQQVLDQLSWSDEDFAIIRELTESPRIQFRELAERLDRPYGIVRRRTMALLEAGVIRSTIIINDLMFEHSCLAILLVKGDQNIRQTLIDMPEVSILSSSTGSRQFVGEVHVSSREELALLAQKLSQQQEGMIETELLLQVAVDKLPASFQL
ncbi:Lrp/AsnC family transcriptional regulator [Vibrio sp.]|uniref:Lrp/AsnC family transcriptional regulator n=1 Tax=Vibrio viridaestus TaxID=2487322 RepID=A0A3N9U1V1_9VIBR|nr:Lrp/AsnC family transcriptional regulator [Vibrio viridaestus]MDC0610233.1 Lrp/AsnC family transcriptional regulator [Vibrio sp.]RQW61906.1 Lrp/AsnC family transcriptional regulator [Vibrio viridaestus]